MEALVGQVRAEVQAEIKTQLHAELDRCFDEVKLVVEKATARVFRRFDSISEVLLGSRRPGARIPLEEMASTWLAQQPPETVEATARQLTASLNREQKRLKAMAERGLPDEYLDADSKATFPEDGGFMERARAKLGEQGVTHEDDGV